MAVGTRVDVMGRVVAVERGTVGATVTGALDGDTEEPGVDTGGWVVTCPTIGTAVA